ncbi:MAG: hypothetical protein R3A12_07520 [Ignavibacteria bacterium]
MLTATGIPTSTWEMSTNGGSLWFAAQVYRQILSSTITINNTVTVTENVTADQIILSGGSDLSIASRNYSYLSG